MKSRTRLVVAVMLGLVVFDLICAMVLMAFGLSLGHALGFTLLIELGVAWISFSWNGEGSDDWIQS